MTNDSKDPKIPADKNITDFEALRTRVGEYRAEAARQYAAFDNIDDDAGFGRAFAEGADAAADDLLGIVTAWLVSASSAGERRAESEALATDEGGSELSGRRNAEVCHRPTEPG